ncbi:hypothetical protein QE152_g29856 [Popillia japonica]|uniref:Uncharacterized protein n=1 Tax=Popillia japonica TaxID=7064 RepID=A0AAW1JGA3_POPJA
MTCSKRRRVVAEQEAQEILICASVEEHFSLSSRQIAAMLGISKEMVLKTMKKYGYKSYKLLKQLARMKEDGSIKNWSCSSCSVNITKNMPHDGQSDSITCEGVGGSDGAGDAGSSDILQLTRLELEKIIISKVNSAMEQLATTVVHSLQKEIRKLNTENCNLAMEVRNLRQLLTSYPNLDPRNIDGLTDSMNDIAASEKTCYSKKHPQTLLPQKLNQNMFRSMTRQPMYQSHGMELTKK